jgi:hypothetical protein
MHNNVCITSPQIVPKPRSRRAREGPRIENSIEACNVVPMKDKPSEATLASALLTYLVLHYFLLYSRGSLKGEKHDTVLF